jgi:hypothetical protein
MTVSTSVWFVPPLPVEVWIYGGGRQQGSGTDPKHNFGYVVRRSVEMGKPVIGVSVTTGPPASASCTRRRSWRVPRVVGKSHC